MNSESGQLPMHHAMKLITAISVLPERGGMLMIRRFVFPITTRSSASQIGLWWDAGIMSAPLRARNMVCVNVSRSARLSAISFGVIVLTVQRFQNGGAGVARSHGAVRAAMVNLLLIAPVICRHVLQAEDDQGRIHVSTLCAGTTDPLPP